jgi:pimeloyl-ACP methyl ester carboxylesterase
VEVILGYQSGWTYGTRQITEAKAMGETKTDALKVPGASLYYEVTGSGPLLLMIPGAPADAGGFAALVQHLADRYTVVSYDWRGASRSPLDQPPDDQYSLPMQVQGDDADRLLAALGAGPAYVLGCSGGALIALDLAHRHPERVDTVVAHEPPAMNLLPEGAEWQAAFRAVAETYRRDGAGPGMQQFIETAMRTGGPEATGQQAPPLEMPDMSQLPPEMLEGMARIQANSEFFLAHLLATTIEHIPDVAALKAATPRIVVGVGEASQGQMPHRAALALAERLATSPATFPGDHQGFATHPGPFAETVDKVLLGS